MSRQSAYQTRFIIVFVVLFVSAGASIPFVYDRPGEVPTLAKQAALSSPELERDCGKPKNFFLVPWNFRIDHSDPGGSASFRYWFACGSESGVIDANLQYNDGKWTAQNLTARVEGRSYELSLPGQ